MDNKFVWHGSPVGDIEVFQPRESTQKGAFVYAAADFEVAAAFGCAMGSLTRDLSFRNGKINIVERIEGYFTKHDAPIYIYKLPADGFEVFEEDNWKNLEMRCPNQVKPVEVLKFDSFLELYKQLAAEGKIDLYLYPEKPEGVSQNDYDVIQSVVHIYRMNPEKHIGIFDKFAYLYPKFEKIAKYLKDMLPLMTNQQLKDYARSVYDRKTDRLLPELESLLEEENEDDK